MRLRRRLSPPPTQKAHVEDLFADGSADLSDLSPDGLYLDDVVQQANVRVCADGASSYSLTSTYNAAPNRDRALQPQRLSSAQRVSGSAFTAQRVIKESVVVDRPFLYALYNVADGVVFVAGKLERPFWEEADDAVDSDIDTIVL